MAIIWSGATNESLTNTANWIGGVLPGATDDVVVPASAAQGMSANMDGLPDTTGSWYIHPGFKFNIGTSGSPLLLTIEDGLIDHSPATVYFKDGTDASVTSYVEANKEGGVLHIDGTDVTDIYAVKGNVVIDGGIGNITSLTIASGAVVSISSNSNTITTVRINGGSLTSGMAITTANFASGSFTMDNSNKVLTTLRQTAGIMTLNTTGTLASAFIYGGTLDLTNDGQAKTLTNLEQWPGATVTEYGPDDGLSSVLTTITNRRRLLSSKGTVAL